MGLVHQRHHVLRPKDHLGSTRLGTDLTAALEDDLDYLPFGEASPSDSALMTHEFTGEERDYESNLDFLGARYYECTLDRLSPPEPLLKQRTTLGPATWNRYTYALNNPLGLVDPDGLYEWDPSGCKENDDKCKACSRFVSGHSDGSATHDQAGDSGFEIAD